MILLVVILMVALSCECLSLPDLIPLSIPDSFEPVGQALSEPPGRQRTLNDTRILLYKTNVSSPVTYKSDELDSLISDLFFNVNQPTVLYFHGYSEQSTDESVVTVISAYLQLGGWNTMLVDWANLAAGLYPDAVNSIPSVGEYIGKAILKLMEKGLSANNTHLLGHSLGSHLAGYVARYLKSNGYPVARLTGLDPAFPGFYPTTFVLPMSATDAVFVDCILTSGTYGTPFDTAQVNFRTNGGLSPQPGCPPLTVENPCSHQRSWRYYAESVNAPGSFIGRRCQNYATFLSGGCANESVVEMGYRTPPGTTGDYYLNTAMKSPFGLGERGASFLALSCECLSLPDLIPLSIPDSFEPVGQALSEPPGRQRTLNDTRILLYKTNVSSPVTYKSDELDSLISDLFFNVNQPTVLYFHGYSEQSTDESVVTVISAYLQLGGWNTMLVDWANLAAGLYPDAVNSIPSVGEYIGKAILKLMEKGLSANNTHLLGHSLGSHLAGYVARYLKSNGYPVARLTGLDPAFPGFYPTTFVLPMSATDAVFVDCILTSGTYGTPFDTAQVNFRTNGGLSPQPGCPPLTVENPCSHQRSWRYYAESVNAPGSFIGRRCQNYATFLSGGCANESVVEMGYRTPPGTTGDYYLNTAMKSPFGLGERGASF